jgi:hypothetical protein
VHAHIAGNGITPWPEIAAYAEILERETESRVKEEYPFGGAEIIAGKKADLSSGNDKVDKIFPAGTGRSGKPFQIGTGIFGYKNSRRGREQECRLRLQGGRRSHAVKACQSRIGNGKPGRDNKKIFPLAGPVLVHGKGFRDVFVVFRPFAAEKPPAGNFHIFKELPEKGIALVQPQDQGIVLPVIRTSAWSRPGVYPLDKERSGQKTN